MKPEGDILEMKSEIDSMLLGSRKDWINPNREEQGWRRFTHLSNLFLGLKCRG